MDERERLATEGERRLWCTGCQQHYIGTPPKYFCTHCDGLGHRLASRAPATEGERTFHEATALIHAEIEDGLGAEASGEHQTGEMVAKRASAVARAILARLAARAPAEDRGARERALSEIASVTEPLALLLAMGGGTLPEVLKALQHINRTIRAALLSPSQDAAGGAPTLTQAHRDALTEAFDTAERVDSTAPFLDIAAEALDILDGVSSSPAEARDGEEVEMRAGELLALRRCVNRVGYDPRAFHNEDIAWEDYQVGSEALDRLGAPEITDDLVRVSALALRDAARSSSLPVSDQQPSTPEG
jgi:hypothetical protein